MVGAGRVRTTRGAREGAVALGLDFEGMLSVLTALTTADFYKSMTTHGSSRVWQDVYRPVTRMGAAYVKLTVNPAKNLIVLSFKEL